MRNLRNFYNELLDFGLEYEISYIDRNNAGFNKKLKELQMKFNVFFNCEHDGSCESPDVLAGSNKHVRTSSKNLVPTLTNQFGISTVGGELVSQIISPNDCKEWYDAIYKLTEILQSYGESEDSLRDSLHVHVNLGNSFGVNELVNLVKMCLSVESLLFHLGGLGKINRGFDNDFIFQRPLYYPPVVRSNSSYFLAYEMSKVLNATSKKEFFEAFGNCDYHLRNSNKYITPRYTCVNFTSLYRFQSLEFRTANKSLNPSYVIAWVEFCRAIVYEAIYGGLSKEIFQKERLFSDNYETTIEEFSQILDNFTLLKPSIKNVLYDIFEGTPVPTFENMFVKCHLGKTTYYTHYLGKSITSKVKEPKTSHVREIKLNDVVYKELKRPQNFKSSDYIKDCTVKLEKINVEFLDLGLHQITYDGHNINIEVKDMFYSLEFPNLNAILTYPKDHLLDLDASILEAKLQRDINQINLGELFEFDIEEVI
jgi:hypothetical protein